MGKRVYLDTSVLGGCFEEEVQIESLQITQLSKQGDILLVLSEVLFQELRRAPNRVRVLLTEILEVGFEPAPVTATAEFLAHRYLDAGVLARASENDALHVAVATVAAVDVVLSWNFRHMVKAERQASFNSVNLEEGFKPISIMSPKEFLHEL